MKKIYYVLVLICIVSFTKNVQAQTYYPANYNAVEGYNLPDIFATSVSGESPIFCMGGTTLQTQLWFTPERDIFAVNGSIYVTFNGMSILYETNTEPELEFDSFPLTKGVYSMIRYNIEIDINLPKNIALPMTILLNDQDNYPIAGLSFDIVFGC